MGGLISTIAEILHSRGWLSNPESPLKKVDEAVKSFQNWAGLPADGTLTKETQEAINAPRICGLPDVLPLAMDAQNPCRWPDGNITYFVNDAFPGLTENETWEVFDWALGAWAAVAGITPSRASDPNSARIIAFVRRLDGPNGVLAQSELPCGGIRRARQEYDSAESWNRTVQARLVALHELGHALGIGHISSGNVMAPIYNGSLNKPQAGDIAELKARYGPPIVVVPPTPQPPVVGDLQIQFEARKIVAPASAGWTLELR